MEDITSKVTTTEEEGNRDGPPATNNLDPGVMQQLSYRACWTELVTWP